jgi:uncharacterized membrane protein YhaH (DUF805 family)
VYRIVARRGYKLNILPVTQTLITIIGVLIISGIIATPLFLLEMGAKRWWKSVLRWVYIVPAFIAFAVYQLAKEQTDLPNIADWVIWIYFSAAVLAIFGAFTTEENNLPAADEQDVTHTQEWERGTGGEAKDTVSLQAEQIRAQQKERIATKSRNFFAPGAFLRGRINRSEWLIGIVAGIVVSFALTALCCLLAVSPVLLLDGISINAVWSTAAPIGFFTFIFIAISISLLLTARRLHDIGHSAWHTLWLFVPIVNFILFLWLIFAPGDRKPNPYGAVPTTALIATSTLSGNVPNTLRLFDVHTKAMLLLALGAIYTMAAFVLYSSNFNVGLVAVSAVFAAILLNTVAYIISVPLSTYAEAHSEQESATIFAQTIFVITFLIALSGTVLLLTM